MSVYQSLNLAAGVIAELSPALESLHLCANFLRNKQIEPSRYPGRTVEELTAQLLEAEARVNELRAKL